MGEPPSRTSLMALSKTAGGVSLTRYPVAPAQMESKIDSSSSLKEEWI